MVFVQKISPERTERAVRRACDRVLWNAEYWREIA